MKFQTFGITTDLVRPQFLKHIVTFVFLKTEKI